VSSEIFGGETIAGRRALTCMMFVAGAALMLVMTLLLSAAQTPPTLGR
jgi:hypothetical protein